MGTSRFLGGFRRAACPMTVAQAAPATPQWHRKMNTGSRIVLIMAPSSIQTMEKRGLPSARIRLLMALVKISSGIPTAVMRV